MNINPSALSGIRKRPYLILIFLIAIHGGNLLFWHARNDIPFGHDAMEVAGDAVCWTLYLGKLDRLPDVAHHVFAPDTKTPPAYFWLSDIASRTVGPGWMAIHLVPALAFFILLISVYLLAKHIASQRTGILAAGIVGFYPAVFGFAHTANTSLLAAAFETHAILLILKSKNLTNKAYTLSAALCVAIALLSERGSPVIILAAPLLITGLKAVSIRVRSRQTQWGLFILFFLIPIFLAGPYLIHYTQSSADDNLRNILVDYYNLNDSYPFKNYVWAFYLIELGRTQIGGILSLFFFGGLAFVIRRRISESLLILSAIFPPMIIFSLFATKDMSYDFGILPFIAVTTAVGIMSIGPKGPRRIAVVLVVLGAILTYSSVYHWPTNRFVRDSHLSWLFVNSQVTPYSDPREGIPLKEAADILEEIILPDQILVIATPKHWQPSGYDKALSIEIAARRPDCRVMLVNQLPGSNDRMIILTPAKEIPIEYLHRLDAFLPGPCIGDYLDFEDPSVLVEILSGANIDILVNQDWEGHAVSIGVFHAAL
jgi:Dolichyl-phosphate-mannose-protein mannosyltransferase